MLQLPSDKAVRCFEESQLFISAAGSRCENLKPTGDTWRGGFSFLLPWSRKCPVFKGNSTNVWTWQGNMWGYLILAGRFVFAHFSLTWTFLAACRRFDASGSVWLLVSISACQPDAYLCCQPRERWILHYKPTPLILLLSCVWQLHPAPSLGPQHSRPASPLRRCNLRVLDNTPRLTEWTATGPPTCTWGLRCRSRGPLCRGPPSARGAGTTACCLGSKVTSATAASRTAPARSASSSSSGSASWRRRWRSAGSRPTRVWRASSRSHSECCPASA